MNLFLIGLLITAAFFCGDRLLRRHADERLQKRVILVMGLLTFAVVFSIIAAIQLGFITDHYP